uniref:Pyridoxine/pyridoxamine 5'-phosphate oxidase n=1 Tax=Cyanothece sp. (strain PCC 7425 / ATCC 29141) TaxID=395961 RepID=PDXH_CYAP4|nr:RecName: Full=Pyridoxine/pyridoxamine 5'-phosphate oxidase; AltName: Full=PNP/PMP oxidase; Short=PNPOx; AltName: Full=Pyridoxal 5'-phosphate synthase [Cyanothece sp. PCC 7425]
MTISISDLRKDYRQQSLSETEVDPNPLQQFQTWFKQAIEAEILEPNAMTLATLSREGKPAARIVLLKEVDDRGFTFFTNYKSRKGEELAHDPWAALVFWWAELERQVRIEGSVSQVSAADSDRYFSSRPWGSRLGAWASEQSKAITGREVLEQNLRALEQEYRDREVPRPPHWGGYRLSPTLIEFWQGRPNRLHDRLCYRLQGDQWQLERLSP